MKKFWGGRLGIIALVGWFASPAFSGNFQIRVPVSCVLGEECYIQNYVDQTPGPGASDLACGTLSYDGHKGTDFALPNLAAMERGVDIVAAAPGTVRGVRDQMLDVIYTPERAKAIKGRDCGNGVVISHGGGWETQYCHMKQGTVRVRHGQKVAMGQVLGQIGLSGRTQFPHLHLSVRQNGKVVDPFDPGGEAKCGVDSTRSLWLEPPEFVGAGLLEIGFDTQIPDYQSVKSGKAVNEIITRKAGALVIYGYGFGARKGDRISFTLSAPSGRTLVDHNVDFEKNRALFMQASGLRRKAALWNEGMYRARISLLRDGKIISEKTETLTLR